MGLRKMTVDYVSLSKDAEVNDLSIRDRLLNNTSGVTSGMHEKMMNQIIAGFLRENPHLGLEAVDVFAKVVDKLTAVSSPDFDADKSDTNIESYCIQMWYYAKKEITQEFSHAKETAFVSDDDKRGDEEIKSSTEDLMLKQNRFEIIEDTLSDDEARATLVESLNTIMNYQDLLMTTKKNHINALRVLQAHISYEEFLNEQHRITKKTNKPDSQIPHVSQSSELIVSYGGNATDNIKNGLKRKLAEHFVSAKEQDGLYKAYLNLMYACDQLEIPIVELDAEKIMDRDYLKSLYLINRYKQTICVSEYDLEEFQGSLTAIDVKEMYVKDELAREGVPSERIPHYFTPDITSKLYRVKISDLRRLDGIVDKVKQTHITFMEESKFAGMKEKDKTVSEIKTHTREYKERYRRARTTILIGHEDLLGPLSEESLKIIKRSVEEYFSNILLEMPTAIPAFYERVRKQYIFPNKLVADNNGFLMYPNGMYFQIDGEAFGSVGSEKSKQFIFNKWIVNERGFIVSKFLDADVRTGENLKVMRAGKKRGFSSLIIKDIINNTILNGYEG